MNSGYVAVPLHTRERPRSFVSTLPDPAAPPMRYTGRRDAGIRGWPDAGRAEQILGGEVCLDIADALPSSTVEQLVRGTFDLLRDIDRRFGPDRPDSELSRFDRKRPGQALCSADLRALLERCAALGAETDGYFDAYAGGRLDPSGYVRGRALQLASDQLLAAGVANHSLRLGRDTRIRGRSPSGRPWQVGVPDPWEPGATCWLLAGTNLGVATVGGHGEPGRQVIDPYRSVPASGLRSVTVVGPDLGVAGAYATAAVAMGRAGVRWLAGLPGHHYAVVTDDGRYLQSAGFPVTEPQP